MSKAYYFITGALLTWFVMGIVYIFIYHCAIMEIRKDINYMKEYIKEIRNASDLARDYLIEKNKK